MNGNTSNYYIILYYSIMKPLYIFIFLFGFIVNRLINTYEGFDKEVIYGINSNEWFKHKINAVYMISIFPKDMICPILGIEMAWEGETDRTPSIDKIFPNKGYVEGNVIWVSTRANRIKQDATPEEMMKVAKWLKKQEKS